MAPGVEPRLHEEGRQEVGLRRDDVRLPEAGQGRRGRLESSGGLLYFSSLTCTSLLVFFVDAMSLVITLGGQLTVVRELRTSYSRTRQCL